MYLKKLGHYLFFFFLTYTALQSINSQSIFRIENKTITLAPSLCIILLYLYFLHCIVYGLIRYFYVWKYTLYRSICRWRHSKSCLLLFFSSLQYTISLLITIWTNPVRVRDNWKMYFPSHVDIFWRACDNRNVAFREHELLNHKLSSGPPRATVRGVE